ncbi:conserved hypothetical protein [Neospora caninum Liverpool]|uniref:Uncharacterized protein n=1 Tax=Neospora caninum (strain Liverpool) TaxID=572307 RepID=F0V9M3_NEOCL|nr:conserved hypothetical protein [Neospora caninum Liverpool]CBZ50449.1 conserved hypothetical protein [Neospora caninum Liverpool]CEL65058.1 TPA: hypothetical protein BN1204_009180 [Neospora caninum Liverpool]|eukprot:XP_003880482.1 conserved hypothetical protein [Neospora caninum Liverpool]
MSRNTSSLPQQGTLLTGVATAGSMSRRTASASSFLSQRLGDSFRFLPQPTAAASSKRTRQFLQNLASSSSLSSHEAQQVLTSATDSKVALRSGPSASLRSEVGPASEHRAVKQPKLVTRPCVATIHSNAHPAGDAFSASFAFGSNGPLGPQPEKVTPPPLAFVPGLSRARSQQTGTDSSFASKSVLSLTSRNVAAASRGSSPSPATALLNVKPLDGEKKGASVETADAQAESRAQAEPVPANTQNIRPRSEGACVDTRAPSLLPSRLDFLNLAECCRLIMCDTAEAFGDDFGVDNTHNSRLAQFSYDQAAYKADKAHPVSDYTAVSKRISPETRDLLMCILNQVSAHLAQNSAASSGNGESGEKQEKTTPGSDPLSPRAAATVAIAIQLFDRFMHVVHQNDVHYGVSAEHRMHPLHGLNTLSGNGQGRSATMNNLLLNQMIAIACFCFADRVEAIHAYDYSAVLEAWKQQATGLLRQSWTSSLLSSTVLKQKLMHIERKIISHVPPAGNVSVTPISELTEALLNVAAQFAHLNAAQRQRSALIETTTPSRDECVGGRPNSDLTSPSRGKTASGFAKYSSPLDSKRRASVCGDIGRTSADAKGCQRLSLSGRETAASSRRCSSVSLRDGDHETANEEEAGTPTPSSPFALRLRISGSNEPDMARLIAQLLVRLGQLDRRICLGFKPSVVASAACQIALLPQLSATEISPLSPSGRLAATRAFIASGASTGCRLVRRCQSMLLHKWLKVRNAMAALLSSSLSHTPLLPAQHAPTLTASPGLSGGACSLPDRLAAEWVLSRLTLSCHKKMLELLQFHAEVWAECAAANLKAKALAVGAPVTFIEAVTGAMGAGNGAARGGREPERRGERGEEAQADRRRARSLQPRLMSRDQGCGEERGTQSRASGLTTSVGLYTITALQKELKRAERASIEGRRLRELSEGENANQENRENI